MIKVMWFLKRAEHLSLAEFREWWLTRHAPDIIADQAPYLAKYVVDIRAEDDSGLAGKPAEEPEWDGIAEQWFEDADAYNAVYGRADRPTRADTMAHTSRFQRLVVTEHPQNLD
ncbi:MAG: EthD domain-containing protein [Rhodobacteraceae bacterium HLUCCA24]|nr:MAG: EthD domain-containing protein [Rhodobacteraceae bacterium HLUCCA24]